MIKKYLCQICFLLLAILSANSIARAELRDLPQLNILAASSLTAPMTEITRLYSKTHNITVTTTFNASSEQAAQIIDGNAGDIFISSHPKWMRELKQMGVVDVFSISNLVKNNLVLVSGSESKLKIPPNIRNDLAKTLYYLNQRTSLIVSDPDNTPLGLYIREVLEKQKHSDKTLWDIMQYNLIRTENSKKTLYLIANGNGAGIIYASDAFNNNQVKLLSTINSSTHSPIIYQAAVVAGENMGIAREFLDFMLKSSEVKAIFRKYGFEAE